MPTMSKLTTYLNDPGYCRLFLIRPPKFILEHPELQSLQEVQQFMQMYQDQELLTGPTESLSEEKEIPMEIHEVPQRNLLTDYFNYYLEGLRRPLETKEEARNRLMRGLLKDQRIVEETKKYATLECSKHTWNWDHNESRYI